MEVLFFNTLRPRQNGRHFPDDICKWIFLNENVGISIKISLKFVPKGPINKIPALFQIMAWRRPGDKPLSLAMLVSLLTHKCVTRPQWVNDNEINIAHQWFPTVVFIHLLGLENMADILQPTLFQNIVIITFKFNYFIPKHPTGIF